MVVVTAAYVASVRGVLEQVWLEDRGGGQGAAGGTVGDPSIYEASRLHEASRFHEASWSN